MGCNQNDLELLVSCVKNTVWDGGQRFRSCLGLDGDLEDICTTAQRLQLSWKISIDELINRKI